MCVPLPPSLPSLPLPFLISVPLYSFHPFLPSKSPSTHGPRCSHDIVVFESALHDFALPDRRSYSQLALACGGEAPCTDAQILPLMLNQVRSHISPVLIISPLISHLRSLPPLASISH